MNPIPVSLATEDELSEVILFRILAGLERFAVGTAYRRGGYGYLRRTIHGWNSAAVGQPFIVLTDLDICECPPRLISDWLKVPQHPNLLFRVAVREVEAWLLADRRNLSEFLGISARIIPENPDNLLDPKATLIDLARRSRKEVRDRIVPRPASTAKHGPDYNGCLTGFVRTRWECSSATAHSPSLSRTVERLRQFTPVWP
jgi:hypothetical protein